MKKNWYFPVEIEKSRRTVLENLKIVDLIIEVVDARIPAASHNSDIDVLTENHPLVIILNKADLAEKSITKKWIYYLREKESAIVTAINSKEQESASNLFRLLKDTVPQKARKLRRPLRAMAVGIPNVGKSTLVNRLTKGGAARTGNRPGITRGKQWIKIHNEIELLDTPGILWPKLINKELYMLLAAVGSIQEEVYDPVETALWLLVFLAGKKADSLNYRYKLQEINSQKPEAMLETIGSNKGCLISGGKIDLYRTAVLLLQDFRQGRLGPMSLEYPPVDM